MTKVNMDVMKPWIAKRVTELIGFEDEVLINFIYGLLEGEAVNGKQVQISLTRFTGRNTWKFIKELWLLLLSAQQNVSSVPQQFLDAKEDETKKKKAETDHIAHEIYRKKEKEKQEFQEEKVKMIPYFPGIVAQLVREADILTSGFWTICSVLDIGVDDSVNLSLMN
ncbi:splicing factor PWI domain-containing protein [Perilla frutescens var. hirtella]|uniref:Splicing factor PWI domain-containing protein n=1 Tax=Perilla frutescens var. hirtella TaxID=608512 RepID=A0AAD4JFM6_PERFH|nr:splicing factor PWI domain-containing protein [Perilla frutescens var. hirtella]